MTAVGRNRAGWRERVPRLYLLPRVRDLIQRPALGQRLRALRMSDLWFSGWVVAWGLAIATTAVAQQWQVLATIVWVPAFAMLFFQWPVIGTAALFALWVFAPFLRRVLDVVDPTAVGPTSCRSRRSWRRAAWRSSRSCGTARRGRSSCSSAW